MKSLKDLLAALDTLGIPYTQIQWSPRLAPDLPYAVIVPESTRNRFADDVVAASPVAYFMELYTRERDVPLEKRVQDALDQAGIGWNRYHTVDDDAPCVIAVYNMTLSE